MISNTELDEFKELYAKQKDIEKKLKPYNDAIKQAMLNEGLTHYDYEGTTFTITNSDRVKIDKDGLLLFVAKNKLGSTFIKTIMEPDTERLSQEIGGKITQADYDHYVKTTSVKTLRIK